MSDISKCKGRGCPSADTCWRFLAPASPHWQAYGDFDETNRSRKCEHYWPANPSGKDKEG